MKLKNLLVLALLLVYSFAKAQTPAIEELLKGFDEKKALQEAKKKGLPAADVKGYVSGAKARYIQEKLIASGDTKTEVFNERVTFVNMTKQGMQEALASACTNSDFMALPAAYTNWTGDVTTNISAGSQYPVASWTSTGFNGNGGTPVLVNTDPNYLSGTAPTDRHVIMNKAILGVTTNQAQAFANGYDPVCQNPSNSQFDLPVTPGNGQASLRLGSEYNQYTSERLRYAIAVTAQTAQFTYQFATVINQSPPPFGHTTGEQPAFVFQLLDINNNQVGGNCGVYIKDANQASTDTSFISSSSTLATGFNGDPVFYRKWRTVTVDLTAYIGQTIYADFQTLDCIFSGHFCYAYITATCGSLNAQVSGFCGSSGNVTMTGPPGFDSYQWYGPPNGTVLIPGATTYSYSAPANPNDVFSVDCVTLQGCTTKLNVSVSASNIIATGSSTPSCKGGSTGSASVNVLGGTQFTYTWSPVPGSTSTITNQPTGVYQVLVHDLTGNCPDTTVAVTIGQTLPPLQTTTVQLCGTQLSPPLTVPAGSLPNYAWYQNGQPTVISTSATLTTGTVAPTDDFTATYINPSTGCMDSLKTTMVPINISFSQSSSPPCNGGNNGSITVNPSGGNTYTNYDWSMNGSPGGTNVLIPPSLQITGLPQGNYTININPNGNPSCTYSLTVQLVQGVIPPPTLDTLKGCGLDNLSIPTNTVSGNTHSWWQGTTSLGSAYPYTTTGVTNGAVYTDTIRNSFGCVSVYKAYLKKKDFNLTLTSPEKLKCHNDSNGKLKATVTTETNGPLGTAYTFNWNYPVPYIDPPPVNAGVGVPQSSVVAGLHAGTYTVVVTSGSCVQTKTITLTNPALLPPDSLFAYFCPKDSLVWLYAEPGHSTYNWLQNGVPLVPANNDDSLQVTPSNINQFTVWYLQAGCRDTASILFSFPAYHAFRPDKTVNIFTPNADKNNDQFFPFYSPTVSQYEIGKQVEDYEIVIFNRWGKKVFESKSYPNPWNGDVEGTPQDDGTYYYILKYRSNCGTKADIVEKHGFVQLLR